MVVIFAIISINVYAQDSVSVKIGFRFNPQGSISIKQIKKGSQLVTPLLLVVVVNKGKNTFLTHYNLIANAVGVTYARAITDDIGVYAFGNKFVLSKGGYASVGVTRKLGFSYGFVEFGTTWNKWSPDINVGVIIPFAFQMKIKN